MAEAKSPGSVDKADRLVPKDQSQALGLTLVALRKYQGLTQGELAAALGIPVEEVERDEASNYRGLTVEKALKMLKLVGMLHDRHGHKPWPPPRSSEPL